MQKVQEMSYKDMDNNSGHVEEEDQIELPPGFRFHPTDEELISHYLHPKVLDSSFSAQAVGEVDLNKNEPWELPWKGKMGEDEWYFFSLMDRKYPTGQRTNRATPAGYWKATGKDKEIYKAKALVGMKKTLVFYKGRAPKGAKSNWVMHEYKLEGSYAPCNLPKTAKNDWIICRIFQKTSGGKKISISGLMSSRNDLSPVLPPLMDSPSNLSETRTSTVHETSHVTCFSGAIDYTKMQQDVMIDSFITSPTSNLSSDASHHSSLLGKSSPPKFSCSMNDVNMQQDKSMYGMLVDNNGDIINRNMKAEITPDGGFGADTYPGINYDNCQHSFGEQEGLSIYAGSGDFDFFLNY